MSELLESLVNKAFHYRPKNSIVKPHIPTQIYLLGKHHGYNIMIIEALQHIALKMRHKKKLPVEKVFRKSRLKAFLYAYTGAQRLYQDIEYAKTMVALYKEKIEMELNPSLTFQKQ